LLKQSAGNKNLSLMIQVASSDYNNQNLLRIICILICITFLNLKGYSQEYEGTIIRVIDGDTYIFLTANGSFTVRMYGIDAPEHDQPYGKESSEFLSKYLNSEAITKVNGTDKDDRSVGTLLVNSRDINLLSIKGGFSWHYKRYSSDTDYATAEEYAKRNKLRIWSLPNPIPPWTWRQRRTRYTE
jgi:endonuclease YncB( thermonuclease family)